MNQISPPKPRWNVRLGIQITGTVVSSALLIWLISRQDWNATLIKLRALPLWVLPLCLGLAVSGMLFNSLRWYILVHTAGVPISWKETARIVFAGAFASNFLPSTIGGDVYRVLALLRFTSDKALALASVFVDRGLNVVSYFSLLPFAILTFGSPVQIWFNLQKPAGKMGIAPILGRVWGWTQRIISKLLAAFGRWRHRPAIIVLSLLAAYCSNLVIFTMVWLLAIRLGIPVRFYQVIGTSTLTYLITLLPVSVNGYGLREITITTLYMHLGATLEQATTLAILSRLFMLLESMPGAFWLGRILRTFEPQPEKNPL
jgi:uncharacterized membrane protein YbhN (UPF0104 family)